MRRFIISLLLASTIAGPAMAQDRVRIRDRGGDATTSERVRADRSEQRAERRAERAERAERAVIVREPVLERSRVERARRDDGAGEISQRPVFERQRRDPLQVEQIRERRGERSAERLIEARRAERSNTVVIHRDRTPAVVRTPSVAPSSSRQWTNHWRSDRRYDWRRHRDRHRSLFQWGNYWDPYGYHYRRFSIGFNLWPSYYGSQFWLDDPWQYRLPPAYGPYRWIRYFDDALLVNIYTGQVVDVEHNFFW